MIVRLIGTKELIPD